MAYLVPIKFIFNLDNQGINKTGNVGCILLLCLCCTVCAISHIQQSKRIVNAGSQDIDKRNALDGGPVTKNSDAKEF